MKISLHSKAFSMEQVSQVAKIFHIIQWIGELHKDVIDAEI